MQKRIEGQSYVLGDKFDAKQIIPPQYLTFNSSIPAEFNMFEKFALCGVPDDGAGLPRLTFRSTPRLNSSRLTRLSSAAGTSAAVPAVNTLPSLAPVWESLRSWQNSTLESSNGSRSTAVTSSHSNATPGSPSKSEPVRIFSSISSEPSSRTRPLAIPGSSCYCVKSPPSSKPEVTSFTPKKSPC